MREDVPGIAMIAMVLAGGSMVHPQLGNRVPQFRAVACFAKVFQN
jgi:hypothetical protein